MQNSNTFRKIILTQAVLKRGKPTPLSLLPESSGFKVLVLCPICKEERYALLCAINRYGHTCCHSCTVYEKGRVKLKAGDKFGRLVVLREAEDRHYTEFKCSCGVVKVIKTTNVTCRSGIRSCGCLLKDNIAPKFNGPEDHPNWKGGVSSIRDRDMKTTKYKEWRNQVFSRDGYTCQKCGQIGGRLNAHHILSYSLHPDLRYSVDNGITLCQSCHIKFHSVYGKQKHTEEDINSFISNV